MSSVSPGQRRRSRRQGKRCRAAVEPTLGACSVPSQASREVTTGGKTKAENVEDPATAPIGIDPITGEPFDATFINSRHGFKVTRHLTPIDEAPANTALIDALAFTILPPIGESFPWLLAEMRKHLPIDRLETRNGCFGFKDSARFGNGAGLIAWGGESQRRKVYFSIQGQGCALVRDWPLLASWLKDQLATMKRVDVAYDDIKGEVVSVSWAIRQFESGGFNTGGRHPSHQVFGDWLAGEASSKGRTLGVGSRTSGKYCRIYEKGKQQGDPKSPWTRIEVEWHGKDRLLPYEMLTEPGKYLAGAYPCLAFLAAEQARIKTIANSATITFESAVDHARKQTGKLVNLMLQVFGGDVAAVVDQLRRDGVPKRIEPFSHHLAGAPEQLDRAAPGSFADKGLLD